MRHGGVDDFVEIVGKDGRRHAHGQTHHALEEQQRKFHRQGHRFLLAPVVRGHPVGDLGVVECLQGERRQASLDISACCCVVTREYIAPVSLGVDQQLFLTELHQRVLDRCVAVRVILHGVAHDVGHLVVAAVVDGLHRVQYASLHRFQTVVDMWHGAFEYHVGSIVEKPVAEHAAKAQTRGLCADGGRNHAGFQVLGDMLRRLLADRLVVGDGVVVRRGVGRLRGVGVEVFGADVVFGIFVGHSE